MDTRRTRAGGKVFGVDDGRSLGGVVGLSVFASLVIASCGSTVPATVVATTLGTSDIPLRTVPPIELPAGAGEACAGIGIDAVIHGDTHDPHVAWLINKPAMRIDVLWPAGYRARFAPELEVLDAGGAVVLREGDPVTGGCVTGDLSVLELEPPFK